MSTFLIDTRTAESAPPEAPAGWRRKCAAAAACGLWVLTGVYLVAPDQQAVVTRFGAVVEPRVMPGLHVSLPWPIDRVAKLKVRQLQRLVIGGDLPDSVLGRTQPLAAQFLTGDQNIINMRVVVQYSVAVPADYLFRHQEVARAVGEAVEAELTRRIHIVFLMIRRPPRRRPFRKKCGRPRRSASTIT